MPHPCCLQRSHSHCPRSGSSTGLSLQGSIHPGKVQGAFGNQGSGSPGDGGWLPPKTGLCPQHPLSMRRGTALLSHGCQSHFDLMPLLKCQTLAKLIIFLQSAKSQGISHKACSKGHILLDLLFVCWPRLSLVGIYSCSRLGGFPAPAASALCSGVGSGAQDPSPHRAASQIYS